MNKLGAILLGCALLVCAQTPVLAVSDEQQFREIYKELVETDTTLSGSCTRAAERAAERLRSAGFTESELTLFTAPGHPNEGGLVAVYPGRMPQLKAILLLAHLDVVDARPEDWKRNPFKLIESEGTFYARGVIDDKAEAAIWVDTLVRFRAAHYRPPRTIKIALTCGEEGANDFDGAEWLTHNRRDLIDAGFAINEGAWGELDAAGHRVALEIEDGEKSAVNFRLVVTNRGGHSSLPVKDNAIYRLAGALKKIESYTFPAQFNDANRAYFTAMAKIQAARGETALAQAMNALVRDANNSQAIALVSERQPSWNATLRTTCIATMLDAGHATNALPQRASANLNCRVFPGVSIESVRAKLSEVIGDPEVTVSAVDSGGPQFSPPPLTPQILRPLEKLAAEFWPGVPVLPILQPGETDGEFLNAAGIPTYGIEPLFVGADLGNIHGLNEHVSVQSLLECRRFLYRLVRAYAEQP